MVERYSIGVDIGGTFTDLVMFDEVTGRLYNEKVLTTPKDPSVGVLEGIERILAANGASAAEVCHVIHGTTLVANAVIERRGSRIALVATRGFADLIEIGTEWRYDIYDLSMQVPEPLVPRRLRFEVAERLGPDGAVLQALDENEAVAVAHRIAQSGVAAVAICLLHSFRNPQHERRLREILRREAPDVVVCISSDVMPEIGEYERTSTTVCNAYVLPVFEKYLKRLTEGLRGHGVTKDLYLMLSDGGTVHESTAAAYPVRLVQSGPAGGVQAIIAIGAAAGERNLLCFDMGGTTAKACLVDDGRPLRTTEFEVARVYRFKKGSGLPLRVPVIEMIEIGAGGGSISRVDHLGLVQVGPESSSADPGPACYGRGGLDPTVTDADLVLGYLSPDNFLGGDMPLDVAASERALQRGIAAPLGLSVLEAAWAIHETVNENMAQAASMHALEKARRITDYVMVPIGGAGPVHACNIAMKLGLSRVLCPLGAGVASAQGFLVAPVSFTLVRGGVVVRQELGLNETTVLAGPPFTMIEIDLVVDGEPATTYRADGLIISTPVGSTAYNLSAGGPIVRKDMDAFVFTPLNPHTLTNRTVIDSAARGYEVRVPLPNAGSACLVDGRVIAPLVPGDAIRIRRAEPRFTLVEIGGHGYYDTLRDKLAWGGGLRAAERAARGGEV